jgi:hypothetical protein
MKPATGDLAYCVVPDGYKRTFHMRFCTIRAGGVDDLSQHVVHGLQELLFCEWCKPVMVEGIPVRGCWMRADWMRKVSGPGAAEDDAAACRKQAEARERIEFVTESETV